MSGRRFLRAPSPDEYGRMTQSLRLEVAELVAAQLDAVNKRRLELAPAGPPAYTASDLTAEEVRQVALVMLPRVQQRWPDPPEIQAHRRAVLENATAPKRVAA